MACFCFGVTRPNTVCPATVAARAAGSSGNCLASRGASAPGRPSIAVTAPTEAALSPESTLTVTPSPVGYASVRAASGRSRWRSATSAAGRTAPSRPSTGSVSSASRPSARTRSPSRPSASASARCGSPGARITSGAPSTQVPRPSNVATLNLRADENGTEALACQPTAGALPAASARIVGLGTGSVPARAAITCRTSLSESNGPPGANRIPARSRSGAVSVPVLSTHSTSTRASTSTAGSCWTRHRRRPNRITPTANATEVIRTRPSGIIGTTPATLPTIASDRPAVLRSWPTTSSPPTGTISHVTIRRMRLMPVISSERVRSNRRAWATSRLA